MKQVEVYTDGACRGNPGRGGFGVVLKSREFRREMSSGFRRTTNNRMEVLAVIAALEALKEPCILTIYSDSRYLIDTMEKGWLDRWRKNGWKNKSGDAVKNIDLWRRFFVAKIRHRCKFIWVKGHAENPENNRCDELATAAADGENLLDDEGFSA